MGQLYHLGPWGQEWWPAGHKQRSQLDKLLTNKGFSVSQKSKDYLSETRCGWIDRYLNNIDSDQDFDWHVFGYPIDNLILELVLIFWIDWINQEGALGIESME